MALGESSMVIRSSYKFEAPTVYRFALMAAGGGIADTAAAL
ncbi:MAG: hypothetical protein V4569_08970 [Pseudomonadota bacterium]